MSKRRRWYDRNGVEIHEGDTVRDVLCGKEELVYACECSAFPEEESLGINATNEAWLKHHPDWPREIYPFESFICFTKEGKNCLEDFEKVV